MTPAPRTAADQPPRRSRGAAAIASGLEFENVSRRFGRVAAVDGVSLAVAPGSVVALLGQSGCGKTTLLRIAAGVETLSGGRVLVDRRPVATPTRSVPPERRAIGLMFQDYALFPHMTILRNVMFGLTALARGERQREARAALARVGLEHMAESYPHEASGGEQQRVALARAVAPRPGILLMDEPFSGLDGRLRDQVRADTLSVLRDAGATAVIVTHDPEEAMRVSDRIVLMRAGRIVQEGAAAELFNRPASLFAARFFTSLNELPGRVAAGRAETAFGAFPAPGHSEGAAVVVAVRPAGVRLDPAPASSSTSGRAGRVVARRHLGDTDLVEVAADGAQTYLTARVRPDAALAPGSEVRIGFDARDVLIFAAEA